MVTSIEAAQRSFLTQLLEHGLLIPSGVRGVYGKSSDYERVVEGLDRLVTEAGKADGAEVLRFPPVMSRKHLETSDYLSSFPQLAGTVWSFDGTGEQHGRMIHSIHHGEDWSPYQSMTEVTLAPAACYPVYPLSRGVLPEEGKLFDVASYCFRHEPSDDPTRLQVFRMREFVRLGDFETVQRWRGMWLRRVESLSHDLGLRGVIERASDPFFGRGGRLLAVSQREQELKFELLVPIIADAAPTAVMSFNYHQDHFGQIFEIGTAVGAVAHTGCVAFGMDRLALALFKTHGLRLEDWPATFRERLCP
jgi:seryl-tRNA synthetase